MDVSDHDPNESYEIEPNTADEMLRDWWVVKMNGERQYIMPKDLAERFISDPAYRVEYRKKWPERLPN